LPSQLIDIDDENLVLDIFLADCHVCKQIVSNGRTS
jgi:hypothetical protein